MVLEATLDRVFVAARVTCQDDEIAAEITRRVLVADPAGRPDVLAARGAMLAAGRASGYAELDPDDRDAIVLARALGWKTDRIALQLGVTAGEVRARLARGLRALIEPAAALQVR